MIEKFEPNLEKELERLMNDKIALYCTLSQAWAWNKVVDCMQELNIDWSGKQSRGIDSMIATIKELVADKEKQTMWRSQANGWQAVCSTLTELTGDDSWLDTGKSGMEAAQIAIHRLANYD